MNTSEQQRDDELLEACKVRHHHIAKQLLLTKPPCQASDEYGRTALHHAAEHGWVDICDSIIQAGCQVDVRDKGGVTPLHLATQHIDVCHLLINLAADVNAKTTEDYTPLHFATCYADHKCILYLIENGADICAKGLDGSPLGTAFMRSKVKNSLALIASGAPLVDWKEYTQFGVGTTEIPRISKLTPLQCAVELGEASLLIRLLQDDNDPESLTDRLKHAIEMSEKVGEKTGPIIARSWLTSKNAAKVIEEITKAAADDLNEKITPVQQLRS